MDDWIQEKIRKPYNNGVFASGGADTFILKPYFDWKLGGGKFPSRDELVSMRKYTSRLISENRLDKSVMDLVMIVDDELDNIYLIKYA